MTLRLGLALVWAVLVVLGHGGAGSRPGQESATLLAGSGGAGDGVAAAPAAAGPGLARQVYDVLLDRYVTPLKPVDLLRPAAEAALEHAARAQPGEWPVPELPLSGARDADWAVFADWFERLAGLSAPALEPAALEHVALRAMIASVREGHTRYLTPEQYQERLARSRGDARYIGIGARFRGPTGTVLEVFEDGPAARAGLRRGDTIVAIDGTPTEGSTLEVITGQIRGARGTAVDLLVVRHGVEGPIQIRVLRDEVKLIFARWSLLETGVGYVQLRGFPEPSVVDEVSAALNEFGAAGIRGLIMDLRGNTGGRLDVGVRLTSRFVREGVLYRQVDRAGQRRAVAPVGGYWEHHIPVVVLVDGGTASMGEIFTAALQEAGAARIVGVKTAGSVAAGQTFALADGSAVQVTVLEITSGRGSKLNEVGLEPDDVVELRDEDLRLGRDPQLEAALEYIRSRSGTLIGLPRQSLRSPDPLQPAA